MGCACLAAAAVSLGPLAGAAELAIPNGHFETGRPGEGPPSSWTVVEAPLYITAGQGLSGPDPTAAYSGSNFLTASRFAPNPDASFPANQRMGISQTIDLTPHAAKIDMGNRAVMLKFAYNDADNGDNGVVTIEFLDESSNRVGFGDLFGTDSAQTGAGNWSVGSVYARAPAGARQMVVSIAGERNPGAGGTVRNVSFDAFAAELTEASASGPPRNVVHGNLVMFDPNGAWSWYQDERAIVAADGTKLVVGGVGNSRGFGGDAANSDVKSTIFDIAPGSRTTTILHDRLYSHSGGDDHNTAAFLELPSGNILAMYSGHNNVNGSASYRSFYRIYDAETESWGTESVFNWNTEAPGGSNFPTTYSNLFFLPNEGTGQGRIINIARSHDRSPNFMYSDDEGESWQYGGQLTTTSNVGYVNGYFKYVATGDDRIDFIATEHHPRDFNTSLYHGYIEDGKIYNSAGTELDGSIYDRQDLPAPNLFTPVFQANTVVDGQVMTRVWNTDVQSYGDGTIAALFKARAAPYSSNANVDKDDHRMFYSRFDGTDWIYTELGRAGENLYPNEQDYTGLGALHPSNPNVLYVSTEFNPETDEYLGVHEIFKGTTSDHGATWSWTAITENSTHDNLRPLIPKWGENNTALIWFRGDYYTQGYFDAAVVGIVDQAAVSTSPVRYFDAGTDNTTFADGQPLQTSATTEMDGPQDNLWHLRTGIGNDGDVLTSNESGSEDAATLKTTISDLEAGTYEVFAYFWADNSQDWMLQAGFTADNMLAFRSRGSQMADPAQFEQIDTVTAQGGDVQVYRVYVGRQTLAANGSIDVFVDDWSTSKFTERTWYDGVGVARVSTAPVPEPASVTLYLTAFAQVLRKLGASRFAHPAFDSSPDQASPVCDTAQ